MSYSIQMEKENVVYVHDEITIQTEGKMVSVFKVFLHTISHLYSF